MSADAHGCSKGAPAYDVRVRARSSRLTPVRGSHRQGRAVLPTGNPQRNRHPPAPERVPQGSREPSLRGPRLSNGRSPHAGCCPHDPCPARLRPVLHRLGRVMRTVYRSGAPHGGQRDPTLAAERARPRLGCRPFLGPGPCPHEPEQGPTSVPGTVWRRPRGRGPVVRAPWDSPSGRRRKMPGRRTPGGS